MSLSSIIIIYFQFYYITAIAALNEGACEGAWLSLYCHGHNIYIVHYYSTTSNYTADRDYRMHCTQNRIYIVGLVVGSLGKIVHS